MSFACVDCADVPAHPASIVTVVPEPRGAACARTYVVALLDWTRGRDVKDAPYIVTPIERERAAC